MSLNVRQLITYDDLLCKSAELIHKQIDNGTSGGSVGLATAYKSSKYPDGSGYDKVPYTLTVTPTNYRYSYSAVTQQTIYDELKNYMSTNGYNMDDDDKSLISTRNTINFFNALSQFIYDKTIVVSGFNDGCQSVDQKLIYESSINVRPISKIEPIHGIIQTENVITLSYENILANLGKMRSYTQTYTFSGFSSSSSSSSSCSSSSCSSCSSCSCCSSSSSYIVYMLI